MPNLTVDDNPTCTLDATTCPSMCCTTTGQCANSQSQCVSKSVSYSSYYDSYYYSNSNYSGNTFNSSQYFGLTIGVPIGYLLLFVIGAVICYCRRKDRVEEINRMATSGNGNGPVMMNGYNYNQHAHVVCQNCRHHVAIHPTQPGQPPQINQVRQVRQVPQVRQVREVNQENLNDQRVVILVKPIAKRSLPPIQNGTAQKENNVVAVQENSGTNTANIVEGEVNDAQNQVRQVQQKEAVMQYVQVLRAPSVQRVQQVHEAAQIHQQPMPQHVDVGVNYNPNPSNTNSRPYYPVQTQGWKDFMNAAFNRIFQKNAPYIKLVSYQPPLLN